MRILVCGSSGFIGNNLARRLRKQGHDVVGVDIQPPQYDKVGKFILLDLRDPDSVKYLFTIDWDVVYQLAADMGGAGYVFTGQNDAEILHNNALINLNICQYHSGKGKIFYASSACVYPQHNQLDPDNPNCAEATAYPANPDSDYGWEKLFSERLYQAYHRNKGLNVRIARFHNVFGPCGSWSSGREKAPAAMCRKVLEALDGDKTMEIWGDGEQTRSFLYIEDCLDAVEALMNSEHRDPINIGSEEMVTINQLAQLAINASETTDKINIKHVDGPQGVRGRNSDNHIIRKVLGWKPKWSLAEGIRSTYRWIKTQRNA